MTTHTEIAIAGVPWPMYKVLALVLGAFALVVVAMATSSIGPAVLTAAGIATIVWLVGGINARR